MKLTINNKNNNSDPTKGATNGQVFVCILGNDPAAPDNQFGYLDFGTGKMMFSTKNNWMLDPSKMVTPLDKISFPLDLPSINSGRIYISAHGNFAAFPASGPSPSKGNNVLFDKIEFDSGSNPNFNGTCVDFYGISYVLSGHDRKKGDVAYGFMKTRAEIISALNNFTMSDNTQRSGNTGIMKKTFITNGADEVLRILAPKTMGLGDWGNTQDEFVEWGTKCSHFFDDYVAKHCFRGGRKFSFYSKLYTEEGNNTVYWGTTPLSGGSINLWTDETCTVAYSPVPILNLPAAPWPLPDFAPQSGGAPSLYHNVGGVSGDQDKIDWGFLLLGNSAGTGAAANWGSDPLCMAIMVSICRGVMHLDDGTVSWIDSSKYYRGNGAALPISTADMPILYFSSILHAQGKDGKAYVLSYDDVYGSEPTIYPTDNSITIDLHGLDKVKL